MIGVMADQEYFERKVEPSIKTNQTEIDWLRLSTPIDLVLFILSEFSLTILVISYLAIKNLRTSEAGQMVLNMSASLILHHLALLMFSITDFVISADDEIPEMCIVTETLVLYSGLVLVLLMCAEAVNMFFKIVIVFTTINNYVLKASIVAWITPIFLVGITTSITFYDIIEDQRCVPEHLINSSIGLFTFGILIQLVIWIIFFIIAIALLRSSRKAIMTQNNSTRKELQKNVRILFTVSVLLGLPWIVVLVGYFIRPLPNIGDVMLFIAGIIDYFQGTLLFLVQGVRLTEVRQLWKRWLCCRCHNTNSRSRQLTGSHNTIDKL